MIPAGLAATQVAAGAWRASITDQGGFVTYDNEMLGTTWRALLELIRDLEILQAELREELMRRLMATGRVQAP